MSTVKVTPMNEYLDRHDAISNAEMEAWNNLAPKIGLKHLAYLEKWNKRIETGDLLTNWLGVPLGKISRVGKRFVYRNQLDALGFPMYAYWLTMESRHGRYSATWRGLYIPSAKQFVNFRCTFVGTR